MLVVDNVFARIELGRERTLIGGMLRYRSKGYRFTEAYKRGRWDGWRSMLDRFGRFPAGLVPFVTQRLSAAGHSIEIEDTRVRPPPHPAIAPASLSATLMPHQEAAVTAGYEAGRGLIHHPVGAGKTLVLVELVRRCAVPALVLTHRKDLLYQLHGEFTKHLNIPGLIGVMGDGRWQDNFIVIGTFQTINAALKNYPTQAKEFLESRQAVLVDEVHHLRAPTYEAVMKAATNAFYRFGCSATPFREGDPETRFKVEGWTGPVVSHEEFVAERQVPADVFVVHYDAPKTDFPWPQDYEVGVCGSNERNKLVAELVSLAPKPVLVLIERIEHGRQLARMLDNWGQKAVFIYGGDKTAARKQALQGFRDNLCDVLVSSVILDEGVDLPNIRTLVLAGGGRAPHRTIQRVGRGQRRTELKQRLLVFDFWDRGKYTGRHAKQRLKTYKGQAAYDTFQIGREDVLHALRAGLVQEGLI
jgi:superfamily II DNA or RNA helicase